MLLCCGTVLAAAAASSVRARIMPQRQRGAKRQKGAAQAPEVQVETLLARCDRGDLELLLARHVRTGAAVRLDDVLALLPEAKRTLKPLAVGKGPARTGTGLFDEINDAILVSILGRLELKQRLECVLTVLTVLAREWAW